MGQRPVFSNQESYGCWVPSSPDRYSMLTNADMVVVLVATKLSALKQKGHFHCCVELIIVNDLPWFHTVL